VRCAVLCEVTAQQSLLRRPLAHQPATYRDVVPFGVETGEPVKFSGMFHPAGSDLTMAEAKRSRINAFGIQYEGKTGLSKSDFSWTA
jgi:hypothetical protein